MTTKSKSAPAEPTPAPAAVEADNMAEANRGDLAPQDASTASTDSPDSGTASRGDAGNVSPDAPVYPSSENAQQPIGTRPIGNQDNETPAMKIERERAEQDEAIRQSQADARARTEAESTPRAE